MPKHVTVASSSREIWPFKIRVISTFCKVGTSDSFLRRKFENQAPATCRLGPILSYFLWTFGRTDVRTHTPEVLSIDLKTVITYKYFPIHTCEGLLIRT